LASCGDIKIWVDLLLCFSYLVFIGGLRIMNVGSTDLNIAQQVEEVLTRKQAEKEQEELKQQLSASLDEAQATVEELTTALTTKDAELSQVKADTDQSITFKDSQIALYQLRVQQLEKDLSDASTAKASVEEVINSLKSIAKMGTRIKALTDKGVARKGEAFDKQKIKIASLSDEDFVTYIEEMVSMKEEFAVSSTPPAPAAESEPASAVAEVTLTPEEIERFAKVLGCDASDGSCLDLIKKVSKEVQAYDKSKEGASTEITATQVPPPPKLDPKSQVIASLNLETQPSKSLVETYLKLGEAMAKRNRAEK
jgi:predicted phage tail protein